MEWNQPPRKKIVPECVGEISSTKECCAVDRKEKEEEEDSEVLVPVVKCEGRNEKCDFLEVFEKVHQSTEKTTNGWNLIISVETEELEPWAATILVSRPGLAFTSPRNSPI